MFTWISKWTRTFWVLICLPLAACLEAGPDGPALDSSARSKQVTEQVFFGGDVVVRAPHGYCIDRKSLRRGIGTQFVALASCESLSGTRGIGVAPAMITVSVLPRQQSATQPRAADLARSVAPVKVLKAYDDDGVSLVQINSGGDQVLSSGDPRYWRAGMLVNGHLVGLSVYGRRGGPLAGKAGRVLLLELADAVREASDAVPDE